MSKDRWIDRYHAAVDAHAEAVEECERKVLTLGSGREAIAAARVKVHAARAALDDLVTAGRCEECGGMIVSADDEWFCLGCNCRWTDLAGMEPTIRVVDGGEEEMEFTDLDTGETETKKTRIVRLEYIDGE